MQRIVQVLERSDVIVLVELRPSLPNATGRMTFMCAGSGVRWVRVQIACRNIRETQVSWLAHELTHALEIAEAPEIRDQASMRAFYERVAYTLDRAGTRFETRRAIAAGLDALAEAYAAAPLALAGKRH